MAFTSAWNIYTGQKKLVPVPKIVPCLQEHEAFRLFHSVFTVSLRSIPLNQRVVLCRNSYGGDFQ